MALGLLINQTATARLFVVLTSRPEFTPTWGQHGHISQLTLSRLGRRQVPQMIEKATGGRMLPTEVVQQIIADTKDLQEAKALLDSLGSSV